MTRPRVVVLDYGSGNLRSAERALVRAGADVTVSADGVLAYEIGSSMKPKYVIFVGPKIYMLSVLPAIAAAQAILANKFEHRGVVPPSKHLDAAQLYETVRKEGIVAMAG